MRVCVCSFERMCMCKGVMERERVSECVFEKERQREREK